MSGTACFFDELKMDHEGRYTHEARVAQQVCGTIHGATLPNVLAEHVATVSTGYRTSHAMHAAQ